MESASPPLYKLVFLFNPYIRPFTKKSALSALDCSKLLWQELSRSMSKLQWDILSDLELALGAG